MVCTKSTTGSARAITTDHIDRCQCAPQNYLRIPTHALPICHRSTHSAVPIFLQQKPKIRLGGGTESVRSSSTVHVARCSAAIKPPQTCIQHQHLQRYSHLHAPKPVPKTCSKLAGEIERPSNLGEILLLSFLHDRHLLCCFISTLL